MDWTWFLFSFKGRINRAKQWLSGLVIAAWMVLIAALVAGIGKVFGGPTRFYFDLSDVFAVVDPATYRGLSQADLTSAVIHVVGTALFAWVYAATGVKRLHDRNKSGWWLAPFFVLPGLIAQFSDRLGDDVIAITLGAVEFIAVFWCFIEMYWLAGDPWPNRFGPSPLPKPQASHTPWRQDSELEFMPHIGSPPSNTASNERPRD